MPAIRSPDALKRIAAQEGVQPSPSAPDCLLIHASDLRQQAIAAVPQPLGHQSGKLPPLVLFQTTEHQQHLTMRLALRVFRPLSAKRTLANRAHLLA
jgi:hypothetical protein